MKITKCCYEGVMRIKPYFLILKQLKKCPYCRFRVTKLKKKDRKKNPNRIQQFVNCLWRFKNKNTLRRQSVLFKRTPWLQMNTVSLLKTFFKKKFIHLFPFIMNKYFNSGAVFILFLSLYRHLLQIDFERIWNEYV